LDYLQAFKSSLELGGLVPRRLQPFLETIRVNLLRGPNTRWHTDAFKGVTNNFLLIDDDGKSGSDVGFCIKTVESRNNAMFQDVPAGTRVLLHCGRKDWPDQESYLGILNEAGYSTSDIEKVARLPEGFSKGSILGVLTVGKTWKATDQERMGGDLQRRVLAPYEGLGKVCTEIVEAQWLKRPIRTRGNPGVYKADIPIDCLPE
jgi:hypothetical protein